MTDQRKALRREVAEAIGEADGEDFSAGCGIDDPQWQDYAKGADAAIAVVLRWAAWVADNHAKDPWGLTEEESAAEAIRDAILALGKPA